MPPALLGTSYNKRIVGKLPPVRVVNRYVEATQSNQVSGVAILPRPGLAPRFQDGAGPIRGIYREPGLFGGDRFVVSGSSLYRNGALIAGTIAGSDLIRWAGTDVVATLFLCAGGVLYSYNGTVLAPVVVPDGLPVSDVAEINGFILVQIQGLGRRYFIQPGAIVIDPLDFFTAESSPDASVATVTTASQAYLIDQKSTEVWLPTGSADLPFQRYEGHTSTRGATSRDAVVSFDNTIFFVGEDSEQGRIVYRYSDVPQRISDNVIEERLRLSGAALTAIAFIIDGHAFYMWSGSEGTFAFDVSTQTWCEWGSHGFDRFRAHVCSAAAGSEILLGDMDSNNIYTLDPSRGNDNGDPILRVVGGGLPTITRQQVDSLWVQCNTGASLDPDYRPVMRARSSKDGGNTWGDEREASLGSTGQYNKRVIWRMWGQYGSPGFLFEIIDSDNVQTTLQYATVNELY